MMFEELSPGHSFVHMIPWDTRLPLRVVDDIQYEMFVHKGGITVYQNEGMDESCWYEAEFPIPFELKEAVEFVALIRRLVELSVVCGILPADSWKTGRWMEYSICDFEDRGFV
jgi:hypothetical protein